MEPQRIAIDLELLENARAAIIQYEASGDVFERARLISNIGKTFAPALVAMVEALLIENARLQGIE